ncbi:MAG: alpha/beta fold hydrolase [Desulfobacteraceae bacterium]
MVDFKSLYPFKSNYLTIGGLNYHYLDEGRGEPLLMVHGNPTWSFYFRSLVNAFSNEYRVIVPDHMGCGLSDKPTEAQYGFRLRDRVADLKALMDHLDLKAPLTLIVHDWGGMIGLAWALDHLDEVGRIVILNTSGFFPPAGKSIPVRLRLIRSGGSLLRHLVLRFNLFARSALYMAPRRSLPPEVKAGLIAPYNSPLSRLATLKFVLDIPLRASDPSGAMVSRVDRNLARICQCPTLLLWGAHDFVFDRDYYNQWRKRIPGAEAHWFDNAGHYLLEDVPEQIIPLIRRFLHNHPMQC